MTKFKEQSVSNEAKIACDKSKTEMPLINTSNDELYLGPFPLYIDDRVICTDCRSQEIKELALKDDA